MYTYNNYYYILYIFDDAMKKGQTVWHDHLYMYMCIFLVLFVTSCITCNTEEYHINGHVHVHVLKLSLQNGQIVSV